MNNAVFGKAMENVKKQRYKTCNNRKKKKPTQQQDAVTTS